MALTGFNTSIYTVSIQIFEFFLKKSLEFGCVSICQTQLNEVTNNCRLLAACNTLVIFSMVQFVTCSVIFFRLWLTLFFFCWFPHVSSQADVALCNATFTKSLVLPVLLSPDR